MSYLVHLKPDVQRQILVSPVSQPANTTGIVSYVKNKLIALYNYISSCVKARELYKKIVVKCSPREIQAGTPKTLKAVADYVAHHAPLSSQTSYVVESVTRHVRNTSASIPSTVYFAGRIQQEKREAHRMEEQINALQQATDANVKPLAYDDSPGQVPSRTVSTASTISNDSVEYDDLPKQVPSRTVSTLSELTERVDIDFGNDIFAGG